MKGCVNILPHLAKIYTYTWILVRLNQLFVQASENNLVYSFQSVWAQLLCDAHTVQQLPPPQTCHSWRSENDLKLTWSSCPTITHAVPHSSAATCPHIHTLPCFPTSNIHTLTVHPRIHLCCLDTDVISVHRDTTLNDGSAVVRALVDALCWE